MRCWPAIRVCRSGDDTGANGIKLLCRNGKELDVSLPSLLPASRPSFLQKTCMAIAPSMRGHIQGKHVLPEPPSTACRRAMPPSGGHGAPGPTAAGPR